jgi:hypothetical protein
MDQGRTWSAPTVALDGEPWEVRYTCSLVPQPGCTTSEEVPGSDYERASIAVRDRSNVYVTATWFTYFDGAAPPSAISFTRSSDSGASWSSPELLDSTVQDTFTEVVQGSQVAAGPGEGLLAAWYHPSDDGRRVGRFELRTRYSGDGGDTWDPVVTAVIDTDETGLWLGPGTTYKLWWTSMFPRLALEIGGRAHMVYTRDPDPGHDTAEEGDIRYVTSGAPPYDDWSVPETVNDDAGKEDRAQGFPSLAIRHGGRATIVDVIWEDTRLSPTDPDGDPAAANLYYDVFHSWKTSGRSGWTPDRRVTDESSIQSDLITSGTSLAANDLLLFGAWVDRRSWTAINQLGDDIYGGRILRGRGSGR